MSTITELLEKLGPSLSSRVAEMLQQEGLAATNARKRIERAPPSVMKLKGIHFPHNERFLYLESQWKSDSFWEALIQALTSTGSVYGLALGALEARGGLVPKGHFNIISGSPERLKKHVPSDIVLQRGIELGLFRIEEHVGLGECITYGARLPYKPLPVRAIRARLLTEGLLLTAIRNWTRKLGLVSYESVEIRTDTGASGSQPSFGQFRWDLTAPSYIHPFFTLDRKKKQLLPGFVVADALLGTDISERQVQVFLNKCDVMRYQRKTRPFLAIFVGDHFERNAFQLGKRSGVLLAKPDALLGDDVGTALKTLLATLTNAAAAVVKNPDVVIELTNKLGKIEGSAGNLRGALFEMIVGHLVREKEGNAIEIGVEITDPMGAKAEIDVLRIKGNQEIAAYECKGKSPDVRVSLPEVEKWLTTSILRIDGYLRAHPRYQQCRRKFEFWTSGTFEPEALARLQQAKMAIKRYDLDFRDGQSVYEYARHVKDSHFVKLLNEHFLKHPLAGLNSAPVPAPIALPTSPATEEVPIQLDTGLVVPRASGQ